MEILQPGGDLGFELSSAENVNSDVGERYPLFSSV